MKKLLIILLLFFAGCVQVWADDAKDVHDFFYNYINAANSYSQSIYSMYSPGAKIIRQVVKPDGSTANVTTNVDTYIKQMKLSSIAAKARGYKNTYSNVQISKFGDNYKITALRQPSGENYKLKTYMIVKKQPNNKWLIIEELMQTKEQIFLRYAN
ncbi:MAG: hypothetical protein LBJ74_06025 [Heliobacteriaceae bacterium]|nr:hypothetical protein [Heliobacteriaceae bacterium]